jgi:hypothetical protein
MKTKHLFSTLILACASLSAYTQINVTSYSVYSLGIGTSKDKKISGELKSFLNSHLYDLSFEADVMYNFNAQDYHRFSIGLGVNFSPFTGGEDELEGNAITMPCQLEIFPLQNFKRLSFVMELTPHWLVGDEWAFRYLWGIRYTFKD